MDDQPSGRIVDGNNYIEFHDVSSSYPSRKTETWRVVSKNNSSTLGTIRWYGAWRQYCFFPTNFTVFNDGCLEKITEFIVTLMSKRKKD